jgi:hypothetical protein
MRVACLVLVVIAAFTLGGVSLAAQFAFPPDAPVEVVVLTGDGNPQSFSIAANDERNLKLRAWLAANQIGWSPYLATAPGQGILVSGGELRLQFVGRSVLACRKKQACVHRRIKEAEYAFIRGKA